MNDEGEALLSDFGLARIRHETTRKNTMRQEGGDSRYLAPELAYSADAFRSTKEADCYSFAMTIYELGEHIHKSDVWHVV